MMLANDTTNSLLYQAKDLSDDVQPLLKLVCTSNVPRKSMKRRRNLFPLLSSFELDGFKS